MGNNDAIKERLIEIHLAKSDNRSSAVRRFLPAVALGASAYYSFFLAGGLLVGYLGSKIFSHYLLEKGRVDSIFIDLGKWKLHFHHWMMGALFLAVMWMFWEPHLSTSLVGLVLGIMAHDVYDYNDWMEILVRKDEAHQ